MPSPALKFLSSLSLMFTALFPTPDMMLLFFINSFRCTLSLMLRFMRFGMMHRVLIGLFQIWFLSRFSLLGKCHFLPMPPEWWWLLLPLLLQGSKSPLL